ncbi:MAG TPA: hypothetical protein VGO48_15820 [Conexibacter sp.]|jgi:hypothetical protein|nr:hypothetical protein [Conexibacter sp.]
MLVVVGATVLLAALVGTASAGRLSTSSLGIKATFARINFAGGVGTVECEIVVEGAFHERSISKTRGTLSGFLTSARITRCARGGVTVLTETLPWHLRYDSFTGSLPNITGIRAGIVGVAFRIREPSFGIECLSRTTAEEPGTILFNRETGTGATISASVGGTVRCGGGFTGTFSGTTSSLDNGSGTRVTVTLI